MVGIVIVSHSAKLAAGVQELAQQMVQGAVPLALAAGIDDPENPFGTDAMQVYQAIESVYSDEGVVVLMDLGSAVLSAEMALEFLPEDKRDNVRLCEAPLVEGTIAAVVQAANGANLEQIITEARGALAAKAIQLFGVNSGRDGFNPDIGFATNQFAQPARTGVIEAGLTQISALPPINSLNPRVQDADIDTGQLTPEIYLTVQNSMGLHARPAAKFVATASRFESQITVRNVTSGSESVNARSINQIITLGIRKGHEIAIASSGADATQSLAALQQLVEANFGEADFEILPVTPVPENLKPGDAQLIGIPASPGIAIGSAVIYQPVINQVIQQQADNPQAEWQQLQTACSTVRHQIQILRQKASTQLREDDAAIFDAHLLYLDDPVVIEQARQLIFNECLSAAAAWKAVVDQLVTAYHTLQDSYLQARAADVSDVGQQVLQLLTGTEMAPLELKEPAILVTTDLTPSETAQLDPSKVLGICMIQGGATSHSGILARSLGIPAVMGVAINLSDLENGTLIALDGETGQVWVNPDETQLGELRLKRDSQLVQEQVLRTAAQQPAFTRDGHQVKVVANISGVADAQIAINNGAEGVGLLRSEFLYLERESAPTEEEQRETYQAIASILSPHPLIIRTLDIGGDKPLPYLNLPAEANPFLGWRGIRISLDYPDLLKTQLRAILQASHQHPIKVMFPMVASVKEIRAVKEILASTQAELRQAGIPFDQAMEVGIMVEVPAAVIMAEQLAAEVDFFSIGTNDLSQYVMASDRTNSKVATLADAFEPAVLRMIQQTVIAADQAGIWVSVCGELASSPLATPILVGLGVDELSMNPPAIPMVKAAMARLRMEEAKAIARQVLQLASANAVRDYLAARSSLPLD